MTQIDTDKDPRTYAIIGAAIEVHRQLGHGFLEAVYQEALAIELEGRNIPFAREVELPLSYKGRLLRCSYRADFTCFDEVIVEISGQEHKIESFIDLMRPFEIVELVRTGRIAMVRGQRRPTEAPPAETK